MSPGTPGCFLKAYEEVNGKRLYYKLSNYDSYRGVFGDVYKRQPIVYTINAKVDFKRGTQNDDF